MGGRFYDFEDFGMVEACRPFLEAGRLRVFAVDGRDRESWLDEGKPSAERGARHQAWDACLVHEVVPFVRAHSGRGSARDIAVTGCSGGAFHAANFFFRHPDLCDTLIALSGVYSLRHFKPLTGRFDDSVYFNDPLMYLPGLTDGWYLDLYRKSRIVICVGQGPWEQVCLPESRRLSEVLTAKGVPHWFDLWGNDSAHEWAWWRRQLPYFLEHALP